MSAFTNLIIPACAALGIDPLEHGLQLLDAAALIIPTPAIQEPGAASRHVRDARQSAAAWSEIQGIGPYQPLLLPFPLVPTRPALICHVDSGRVQQLRQALLERYPATHAAALVYLAEPVEVEQLCLGDLGFQPLPVPACLYLTALDPLADLRGPEGPALVVARLLGPGGCPWDREQTHRSLRGSLLEEAHEVLEALDADDMAALHEELGDLLLQVLMHSEIGRQAGEFDLGVVYAGIAAKLIRRHPHVFGAAIVSDSGEVLRNWDAIKEAERASKGATPRGLLDGISQGLPALAMAQKMIGRASKIGFDSDDPRSSWAKLYEEVAELEAAAATEQHADDQARARRVEEEFGDLLLAASKLAYRLGVDAESALRAAAAKFRRRFAGVEQQVQAQGADLRTMSVAAKEALWQQAKAADS